MRINRNNYESYLVDYSEGVLSANMKQEVENFLMLNPDIQEEFEMFSNSLVEIADVNYSDKASLKKIPFDETSASSHYFQQLCVAHIENLLPDSERKFLEKLVKDDAEKQKELALFEKTKLIIDNLNFNEKLLLKQPQIIHEVTDANFEEYCIASMEGWLDQAGLVQLNTYIQQHPNKSRVLHTYYKTRLTPDLSIVYPNKSKIRRFSILSPNFKKIISIASSVAAIVVLSFMVYYTSTIDDKSTLSGNISALGIQKPNKPVSSNKTANDKLEPTASKKEPFILHDPFGFEKISGKDATPNSTEIVNERFVVNRMHPIRLKEIECPPCKQILENKSLANSDYKKVNSTIPAEEEIAASNQNENIEADKETPAWLIAQAGISGLNKITNSKLKVEKNKYGDKTRIAFNSKYFSFSTQVDKKN